MFVYKQKRYKGSGAGLVLSMDCFSPSIDLQKQVNYCKANDMGVVYIEQMNCLNLYTEVLVNKSLTW